MNGPWWTEQLAGRPCGLPAVRAQFRPVSTSSVHQANRRLVAPDDVWSRWWTYAQCSAKLFAMGVESPTIDVFGPVLQADERGLFTAEVRYSRRYGGSDAYRRSDVLVVGRPAVTVGALAVTAAVNHRRKVAARREAEVRWRDRCLSPVIATNYRLLCSPDGQWQSFWYSDVTEFYPDLDNWSLTMAFDSYAPLWLYGPPTPALNLWTATAVLGDRWTRDPRMARLVQ